MADLRLKLKRLIQRKTKPDGTTYGLDEIAVYCQVSASTIRQLLTLSPTNPTMDTIAGLAKFFGVSPAYFFESDTGEERGGAGVQELRLLGGQNLSPRDRKIIEEIVRLAAQLASRQEPGGSR